MTDYVQRHARRSPRLEHIDDLRLRSAMQAARQVPRRTCRTPSTSRSSRSSCSTACSRCTGWATKRATCCTSPRCCTTSARRSATTVTRSIRTTSSAHGNLRGLHGRRGGADRDRRPLPRQGAAAEARRQLRRSLEARAPHGALALGDPAHRRGSRPQPLPAGEGAAREAPAGRRDRIRVNARRDAQLELWAARRRADPLARLIGGPVRIVTERGDERRPEASRNGGDPGRKGRRARTRPVARAIAKTRSRANSRPSGAKSLRSSPARRASRTSRS